MKTPLAWKNLVYNKVRTAVALAGVGFAVILIFMQMGFLGAVRKTATQIYDALDFDLMLRSPAYLHLTEPRAFPRERVFEAQSLPIVRQARFVLSWPVRMAGPPSRTTCGPKTGTASGGASSRWASTRTTRRSCRQICSARLSKLTDARFLLIDSKSKPEYGPKNKVRFGEEDIGVETALSGKRARIVGVVELGTGLAANGACILNFDGFARACYWQPLDAGEFRPAQAKPRASTQSTRKPKWRPLWVIRRRRSRSRPRPPTAKC